MSKQIEHTSPIHYEPLRPHRSRGVGERYEFTHGVDTVCVYDIHTLAFVKEIYVGPNPDCHATSCDNRYLYIATYDGLVCIDQDTLEVAKVLDTGRIYATNTLPKGDDMLVHDECGGVLLIKDISDIQKIRVHSRTQVIPNGEFRCEIGGKGNFLENGRYYLNAGWRQSRLYLFDTENDFSFEVFHEEDKRLDGADDLVINRAKTKAYTACAHRERGLCHVAVIDLATREIVSLIPTGYGSCGLTMTNDERYVVVSNDRDNSISVIDTETDTVVNTPTAQAGFDALGITGYIQGISCGKDDSIYVYGCSGNGAIVRFFDIATSNKYIISNKGEMYYSEPKENFAL